MQTVYNKPLCTATTTGASRIKTLCLIYRSFITQIMSNEAIGQTFGVTWGAETYDELELL